MSSPRSMACDCPGLKGCPLGHRCEWPWMVPAGRAIETNSFPEIARCSCHAHSSGPGHQSFVVLRYSLAGQDTRLSPERPGLESRWRNFAHSHGWAAVTLRPSPMSLRFALFSACDERSQDPPKCASPLQSSVCAALRSHLLST